MKRFHEVAVVGIFLIMSNFYGTTVTGPDHTCHFIKAETNAELSNRPVAPWRPRFTMKADADVAIKQTIKSENATRVEFDLEDKVILFPKMRFDELRGDIRNPKGVDPDWCTIGQARNCRLTQFAETFVAIKALRAWRGVADPFLNMDLPDADSDADSDADLDWGLDADLDEDLDEEEAADEEEI